ncbi:MAG: SCO family protein [Ilumatobacteraceae bacterium]
MPVNTSTRIGGAAARIGSGRWALPVLVVAAVGLVACASGSDGGASDGNAADGAAIALSAAGQRGQDVFRSSGCAGCHGSSGEGAVGPALVGLYGSGVELKDGTTVVADDDYLSRAITDPGAEVVADARVPMPENRLNDDEVADVVAYIRDLSGGTTSDGDEAAPATNGGLSGIVREPAPMVDGNSIPSLTDPGSEITFRASPGEFQLVFFGYTHCPDVCPTTLADLTVAMRKLPEADAAKIDTVMVTVDPDRDLDVLAEYVQSFLPEGEAGGTADPARLQSVADAFGVTYGVTTNDGGEIEVVHSGFVYVVDDQGRLVLSWPFGTTSDAMASDLAILFASAPATTETG